MTALADVVGIKNARDHAYEGPRLWTDTKVCRCDLNHPCELVGGVGVHSVQNDL